MNHQQGVSLVITFLIMTVLIAVVLNVSTILFNEIKIIGDSSNSVSAFHAATTGIETTLYYDKKQIPPGGTRGLCNTCNVCALGSLDPNIRCSSCTAVGSACGLTSCTSCTVSYQLNYNGRNVSVSAAVSPTLTITSTGLYNSVSRATTYTGP